MAITAISTPTLVESIPHMGQVLFCINGYEDDASTAISIKTAPGTGKAIYITSIILGSDDADAHPHLQDEDDNVLFGPLFSTIEGPVMSHTFAKPLKMVSNKALEIKAAAAGNVFIFVEGIVATG